MPTQSTTYNSRVTDESLEKRFRDTFRSQGGSELVDDLYAQGVIVPIVDFTAAATGQQLAENLQTAWDFSTGSITITSNSFQTIISNAGFWQVDLSYAGLALQDTSSRPQALIDIYDGSTSKPIWGASSSIDGAAKSFAYVTENKFVVFLRSGDSLRGKAQSSDNTLDVWYRQIATVSGDLVNPSGFTSS